jgi:uncharacterized protein
MSTLYEITVCASLGMGVGAMSGFMGIGGGAMLTPLLLMTLGVSQHRAQGIALAALLPPVGLPAVLAYRKGGVRILPRIVVLLVLGFMGGSYGGARIAHLVPARELGLVFALFLLYSAYKTLTKKTEETIETSAPGDHMDAKVLAIGICAGALSGLLGIGGGLVAQPLLQRYARLSRLEAQATTLAMLLPPIGLPAVYVYAKESGGLPLVLLLAVALGFATGAGFGARASTRAKPTTALRIYAGALVLMAAAIALRSFL